LGTEQVAPQLHCGDGVHARHGILADCRARTSGVRRHRVRSWRRFAVTFSLGKAFLCI
jgi:hypothetical protein